MAFDQIRNMKKIVIVLIVMVLSSCSNTGTALLNTLAKNDYQKSADISYGSHPQNKLDVYTPLKSNNKNQNRPVIVFFYGGCWGECSDLKKSDYLFVAQSLASKGFTVVIADFRQYPNVNFDKLMSDASRVIHWTKKNIKQYAGNPNRIFVAGHSSGAHIAATLALNPRYLDSKTRKSLRGFIGLAGPYDFLPLDEDYQRKLFNSAQNYANSQPINFVSAASPALLILHGEKDTTVFKHNAVNLSKKAQQLGVNQQLTLYPSHSHVSILTALSRPFQGRSTVLSDITNFIRQH